MAQYKECLMLRHEYLSSNPQYPHTKPGLTEGTSYYSTWGPEEHKREAQWHFLPSSLDPGSVRGPPDSQED